MGRNARADEELATAGALGEVRGAELEPIGVVQRELTRPDGTKLVVEVPVYPPFRLADAPGGRKPPRARAAPSLKRKRSRPPASGESR